MNLTERIKAKALELGYEDVGICSAVQFTSYAEKLRNRTETYDFYLHAVPDPLACANPSQYSPCVKSLISLAAGFGQYDYPESLQRHIGRAYLSRNYTPRKGSEQKAREKLFMDYLEAQGCHVIRGILLPDREVAVRAGIATFGNNNFAFTERSGSFVIFRTIAVDQVLNYDKSNEGNNPCPPGCHLCMDSCPTGAIVRKGELNPRKCISFNNWMTQEGYVYNVGNEIPTEMREKIGLHIHGCDICQEVCPRNAKILKKERQKDPFIELLAEKLSLEDALIMDETYYHQWIEPIMYNYIRDVRYFKRNVAIAMGNSGEKKYQKPLKKAAETEESYVCDYINWALEQIEEKQKQKK